MSPDSKDNESSVINDNDDELIIENNKIVNDDEKIIVNELLTYICHYLNNSNI